jgi:hypothetical protein
MHGQRHEPPTTSCNIVVGRNDLAAAILGVSPCVARSHAHARRALRARDDASSSDATVSAALARGAPCHEKAVARWKPLGACLAYEVRAPRAWHEVPFATPSESGRRAKSVEDANEPRVDRTERLKIRGRVHRSLRVR